MSQPAFWALCSAAFATAFGYGAIMPVLPTVLERAGLDASQGASSWHAGALGGLYMLAMGLGAALGARYRPPSSVAGIQPRPQRCRSAGIND